MPGFDDALTIGSPVQRRYVVLSLLIVALAISLGKLNLDATIIFDQLKLRYILIVLYVLASYWVFKAKA